jgi:hypothetical protein
MADSTQTILDLETRFWRALVDKDTAVVAYKVHQKGELKGEPMDLQCADSTAWVKDGRAWKCALHTETILENA